MLIEIVLGIIVLIASIMLFITIFKEKFMLYIIKINEAENNVDILLQKKVDSLCKTIPIVNKELKKDNFLDDLNNDLYHNDSHFELYDRLRNDYNELFNTIDDNEKLLKNKELETVIDELNINEENLIGAIKYYNDSVVSYNNLINKFPSNIVSFIFRYKRRDFYKNEKREIFQILKEETN